MIVNNLDIIKDLIVEGKDEFYTLIILHRSKDGLTEFDRNDKHFDCKLIKTYFVSSKEYLERKMPEIMALCDLFNARAYINLNKKSKKQVTLKSLKNLADFIANETYSKTLSVIESACGETGACDKNKHWLVDVDTKDEGELELIKIIIDKCEPFGVEKYVATIPTVHGYHLITKPFRKDKFREMYTQKIDIQENNPTLLYYKTLD